MYLRKHAGFLEKDSLVKHKNYVIYTTSYHSELCYFSFCLSQKNILKDGVYWILDPTDFQEQLNRCLLKENAHPKIKSCHSTT